MGWFRFIDFWTPQVFSPKVMPDPNSAARLDEKFAVVIQQLKRGHQPTPADSANKSL
jgi:hypothetical protein